MEKFILLLIVFIFVIFELIIYFMNDTMFSSLYFKNKYKNVYSLQKSEKKVYFEIIYKKCFSTKNNI